MPRLGIRPHSRRDISVQRKAEKFAGLSSLKLIHRLMGEQDITLQSGGEEQVLSTRGVGPLGCRGLWEPTQLGGLWTQVQAGSHWGTSSHFKRGVERLSASGGCRGAEDSGPMAGAGLHQMFVRGHH